MIYCLSSLARCELGSVGDDQGEQLFFDDYHVYNDDHYHFVIIVMTITVITMMAMNLIQLIACHPGDTSAFSSNACRIG